MYIFILKNPISAKSLQSRGNKINTLSRMLSKHGAAPCTDGKQKPRCGSAQILTKSVMLVTPQVQHSMLVLSFMTRKMKGHQVQTVKLIKLDISF